MAFGYGKAERMPGPLAYPEAAHFAQDLALGVEVGWWGILTPATRAGNNSPPAMLNQVQGPA